MNDTELKTLNEKLMKFCDFTNLREQITIYGTRQLADYPDGQLQGNTLAPDLVNDLSSQARWIYPKLKELRLNFSIDYDHVSDCYLCKIYKGTRKNSNFWLGAWENINPAISFALTVNNYLEFIEKHKNDSNKKN